MKTLVVSTALPVVADMILRCGTPVNIAFADTKIIDGRIYGQMLLQFPEDEAATAHIALA